MPRARRMSSSLSSASLRSLRERKAIQAILAFSVAIAWTSIFPARNYRYFTEQPLYPFGYGLSFSSFNYSEAKMSQAQVAADGTVTVSARVTNASSVPGDEVVQLYLAHPGVDGAPIRALAGFQRVHLDAPASKTVDFTLRDRDLSVVDETGVRRIVAGPVDVWIGGGQPVAGPGQPPTTGARTTFTITSGATLED